VTLTGRLVLVVLLTAALLTPALLWATVWQEERTAEERVALALAQTALLLAIVLLACLPIVRRVRSLTESVKQREETLRDFIANTTHDVMLPVTVLQGHISEIKRRIEMGEPVDSKIVTSCHREADYLRSILHNLAAVAKLEGADYQSRLDPLSLNRLVDRIVARYRSIAKVEDIGLDFSVPAKDLFVSGDMTLLEQALGNVIHNAVRYNRKGGHVAVLLEPETDGSAFSLKVIDDGPGIPQTELARATERAFRGDAARARNPAGLGLGLHIAREVAARHGFGLGLRPSEYGGLEVEISGALLPRPRT